MNLDALLQNPCSHDGQLFICRGSGPPGGGRGGRGGRGGGMIISLLHHCAYVIQT